MAMPIQAVNMAGGVHWLLIPSPHSSRMSASIRCFSGLVIAYGKMPGLDS